MCSSDLDNFNLSNFVPRKPFFSYTATQPYQPCVDIVNYIVFEPSQSSLSITPDILTKLKKIISDNPYDIKTGPKLFYNEKGPKSNTMNDDIYIDCRPVGKSDEIVEVIKDKNVPITLVRLLKNPVVQLLLGAVVFLVIIYVLKIAINFIKPGTGKVINNIPDITKMVSDTDK